MESWLFITCQVIAQIMYKPILMSSQFYFTETQVHDSPENPC